MTGVSETKNIHRVRTFAQDAAQLSATEKPKGERKEATAAMVKPVAKTPIAEAAEQMIEDVPAIPKKPASPEPAKPAAVKNFPDLHDEASRIVAHTKASILSDTDGGFDASENHSGGTIIRDTKRKRFRLVPAIIQATTDWFGARKNTYETLAHPHHATTNAEARKSVIEAAVKQSAQAPKEDFKTVAQRMKVVARSPYTSQITFKDKAEVPKPQWSYVEDGVNDAEVKEAETKPLEDQQTSTVLETENPAVAQETSAMPEETQDGAGAEPETLTEEVTEVVTEFKEEQAQLEDTPAAIAPAEKASISAEEPDEEVEPLQAYQPPVQTETQERQYAPPAYPQVPQFSTFLLIGVILGATLLGIGLSYYVFVLKDAPQEKAVVYSVPALVKANAQIGFALPSDRTALLQNIQSLIQQNAGVLQAYPTVVLGDGIERPASAEQIFRTLAPRTAGSFNRAVREITFGGVGSEPFVILHTTSFDVAFAGMLQWEKTISADLSPLFGTPVIETFDPSARTDTQVREAFFKDDISSNKNVRVLFDEKGADRMVYTFVDQNTVVITTTREALDVLIPLTE